MLHDTFSLQVILGDKVEVPKEIQQHFEIFKYPMPKWNPWNANFGIQAVKDFIKKHPTDLLISITQPFPLGLTVAYLGEKNNIPTVVRVTGDIFNEKNLAPTAFGRWYKRNIYETIMMWGLKKANCVIPIGKAMEQNFQAYQFPQKQLKTLSQPFSKSFFAPLTSDEKSALKSSLGLDAEKTTVLFVGRIVQGKGIDDLVEIIQSVKAQSDQFQFCIVGDGPYLKHLQKLPSDLVKTTGRVQRPKVPPYYQAADVLVYPTKKDALPNVILEALAAELPILASPVGEIPHLVSKCYSTNEAFVEAILQKDYQPEKQPRWFDWEYQKKQYVDLFMENCKRS